MRSMWMGTHLLRRASLECVRYVGLLGNELGRIRVRMVRSRIQGQLLLTLGHLLLLLLAFVALGCRLQLLVSIWRSLETAHHSVILRLSILLLRVLLFSLCSLVLLT